MTEIDFPDGNKDGDQAKGPTGGKPTRDDLDRAFEKMTPPFSRPEELEQTQRPSEEGSKA